YRAKGCQRRPAVIVDLDETVFDNSPFQTWLYREGRDYSDAAWEVWERDHPEQVLAVPGARQFIRDAERAGVTVVYVSNRKEEHRDSTVRALAHLGISTRDLEGRLLLKAGQSSDKTARRKSVEARYHVLMLLGDSLRDFSEEFKAPKVGPEVAGQNAAIAERKARVDAQRGRWGEDWFVLPNPVYGEWQRLAGRPPPGNLPPAPRRT